jgi:integrase
MAGLNVKRVEALKEPGMHGDGDGLYLRISPSGTKSWIPRVRIAGETARREIGLGSVATLSLAEARDKARELRKEAKEGRNPIKRRDKRALTFKEAATEAHGQVAPTFKNPKHAALWLSSLDLHVFPHIGDKPIEGLGRADVVTALEGIWLKTPDTARRVKQRIATVFDWAIGRGHYSGANPVDKALMKSLPKSKRSTEHMAAMPWKELPAFYGELCDREATAAMCLRFLILTATRSGEARGARWSEIDLKAGVWTIPADRIKMERPHSIPLSKEALAIAHRVRGLDSVLLFPSPQKAGAGKGKELSVNCFRPLYERMGRAGFVTHGFRSTFTDWANESARAQFEVSQACLAHQVGNAVERAYARSDLFDRRRELMGAWSAFVCGKPQEVESQAE